MTKYVIDGAAMVTRAAAHNELTRALELDDFYGRNLDALWDEATSMHGEAVLVNPAPMLNGLEAYGCKLLQTLYEAAQKNPHFVFRVEGE